MRGSFSSGPDPEQTGDHVPQFSILFAPEFQANPAEDGTNSETCIVINFKKRVVLICGTSYAGEMKKSAFTILNYLLPERGVFPDALLGEHRARRATWRCSSDSRARARPRFRPIRERRLIGDDEHGWSDNGVFNFEGGCYAKCIRLSAGERAADLERDPLRHGAGERRDGFGDAPAGFQFATRSPRTRARRIR